ncbi:MAG: hypothetical protein CMC13_00355 [Flavobacteriaceae bacterium]|mgnify:CR=1 FL=1|nr:hypothetical protein [Flavobacteriaceae bacterium]|tara:strand:- start:27811 stop:28194 length:384 start_codon:yes stop_codon:yes gene_type:complete
MVRRYTEAEEQFIYNNYRKLGDAELGEQIDRTATAISKKLTALGLKRTKKQRNDIMKRLAGHTRFSNTNKPTVKMVQQRTQTRLENGYEHNGWTKRKIGKAISNTWKQQAKLASRGELVGYYKNGIN